MSQRRDFEIPLEHLPQGEQEFAYDLDDEFFAGHEQSLVRGGQFAVTVTIERVRSQFNVRVAGNGSARVECDRCLNEFSLPLRIDEELVLKYAAGSVETRPSEDVLYVPFGAESFNVAKPIVDAVGLALPMAVTHDLAGEACDPSIDAYLSPDPEASGQGEPTNTNRPAADSPWSVLQDLRPGDEAAN